MPVPRITKEALKQRLEGDPETAPLILDARLKYPYEHSTLRLPGAIRTPPYEPLDVSRLPRDREIVVYDSDPDELVSARIAAELIRRGFRAAALKGGIAEWVNANYPVETKEAPKAAAPAPGSLKG